MTDIAPHMTAYLRQRLPVEQAASQNTCDTYAYAFQLLLHFVSQKLSTAPSALQLEHIDAPLVLEFLEYLQKVRGNAPRTRNARLTAIKSFMHFVEHRVPSALEQINRVLAIPNQKTDLRLVDHLTAEQCQAILDNPAPHTRLAIRDRAMLHVSVTAGLRVSELVGLRLIGAPLIVAFLDDLEKQRGITVRSRNLRLTAIHSFFHYLAFELPEHSAQIQRVLAIPGKRFARTLISFLNRQEVDALLTAPDHRRILNAGDYFDRATAFAAGFNVDVKYPLQALGPEPAPDLIRGH